MQSLCLNGYWKQNDILDLALDYPRNNQAYANLQYTGWEGPPGGWTMTIGDLARLMVAINTNQIISPATRELMMTEQGQDLELVGTAHLGLGVLLHQRNGRPIFLHTGKIGNYRAVYVMWPEEGVGVAVMINGPVDPRGLAYQIGDRFVSQHSGGVGSGMGAGNGLGVVFTEDDCAKARSHTYKLVTRYKEDLLRLVRINAGNGDDFDKALRKAAVRLFGENNATQIIRLFLTGDHEEAAKLALPYLERLGPPLSGDAASLPREDRVDSVCS